MVSLRPLTGSAEEIIALLRQWERAEDPESLVIHTSGSSGRPKRVELSRAAMRASVDATHARLGGPGQWVLNIPPTYVAGVQVLFRSVRAGIEPVIAGELAGAREDVIHERSFISLVPTQLHRALQDEELTSVLAGFTRVLVGGGPTRPDDLELAAAAGIQVVRTYGMSETCGGCVYDGVPLDGVEVKVTDGSILLRGPVLFDGYQDEPARTAAAFDGGWLRTHDIGRYDDGVLTVLGREDDVVISGGVKVPPQAVEQMLAPLGHVLVFGVADEEWGERVVAAIDGDVDLTRARDLVEPRSWAPRQVVAVDFAWLGNGKPDRVETRRRAEAAL